MLSQLNIDAALMYSRAHGVRAIAIKRSGAIVAQEYGEGFDAQTAHPIYSGAKSFWGAVALCARDDGLLALDEPVARTIGRWADDPWKSRVTVRMLLALTAGFEFGGLGSNVPTFDRALEMPLKNEPGTHFEYGGVPLQVFGAVLLRKLAGAGITPHQYLAQRVLAPAGVAIAQWRRLVDTSRPLPTGATLTPTNWLAYANYVIRRTQWLAPCFEGSSANARYGLGWWLGSPGAPDDIVYASGAGGQALYVIPSLELTIARFGTSSSYRHTTFLKRLFA